MQKPNRTLKHDPKHILTRFYELKLLYIGVEKEKLIFEGIRHVWAGKDHQDTKNIENCSNPISKGSRSMFASQFDMCFYIVNKVVK